MTVYIILFRGVGGATQLPTKPLREALTTAHFFKRCRDLHQQRQCNHIIEEERRKRGEGGGEDLRQQEFGFDKAIYAVAREEWRELIENNPFPDALSVPKFLHAAVLDGKPAKEKVEALRALGEGR